MFSTLFGQIADGRLARRSFSLITLLLLLLILAVLAAMAVAIGVGRQLGGSEISATEEQIAQLLGVPVALFGLTLTAVLVYGALNVSAKRLRDFGLPGWSSVALLALLELGVGLLLGAPVAGWLYAALLASLAALPSNRIARRRRSHFGNRDF